MNDTQGQRGSPQEHRPSQDSILLAVGLGLVSIVIGVFFAFTGQPGLDFNRALMVAFFASVRAAASATMFMELVRASLAAGSNNGKAMVHVAVAAVVLPAVIFGPDIFFMRYGSWK